MNLYNQFVPIINLPLKETGMIMLPVTGTLLGLVYAAFIYWLQGGFSKLEHTRSLLEDLLTANGKVLLDLLIGSSAVSLFAILEAQDIASIALWIFFLVFTTDLLKAVAEAGYIASIFSTKFIPSHYGKFRQFLRKIQNAGFSQWFRLTFLVGIVVVYPLWISFSSSVSWLLSEKSLIIFIFVSSAFSLLQIRSLITEAFSIQKQLDRDAMKENERKALQIEEPVVSWGQAKQTIEQKIISERLYSLGILSSEDLWRSDPNWTSRHLSDKPVISGGPVVQNSGSCLLNVIIPYFTSDDLTRNFIFTWAQNVVIMLAESKTEVTHYTISFSRRDGGKIDSDFGIIRTGRDDIRRALSKNLQGKEFIQSLPGRYLAPAVAEF